MPGTEPVRTLVIGMSRRAPRRRRRLAERHRRARRRILLRRMMRLDEVRVEARRAAEQPRRELDDLLEDVDAEREVRRGEQRAVRGADLFARSRGSCVVPAGRADDDGTARGDDRRGCSPARRRAP